MLNPDVENPARRGLFTWVTDRFHQVVHKTEIETEIEKIQGEVGIIEKLSRGAGSFRFSRRRFLQVSAVTAFGLLLVSNIPAFLPRAAQAEEEWIELGPEPGELNQEEWFPYDKKVAREKKRVKMHDPGGPLYVHDLITGFKALEWEKEHAESALRKAALKKDTQKRTWLGHCDDVADLMAYHLLMTDEVLGGGVFVFEGLEIDKTTIIGLNAERVAHDAMIAYRNSQAGIKALLAVATEKGWAPVSNIPDGLAGQVWSYLVTKVRSDLEAVEVQNFGKKFIFPTSAIAEIYFPFHYNPNDPESYEGVNWEVRARTAGAFNPELDHEVVARITLNQPR